MNGNADTGKTQTWQQEVHSLVREGGQAQNDGGRNAKINNENQDWLWLQNEQHRVLQVSIVCGGRVAHACLGVSEHTSVWEGSFQLYRTVLRGPQHMDHIY